MLSPSDFVQMLVAVLSVPVVAAGISWLARRFSKEARLTIRLERLAAVYPNLPDGPMREEFGRRVAEAGAELNARLDPLFKRERRRKRKVVAWLLVATAVLALLAPGLAGEHSSSVVGVVLGIVGVGGFLLIERDTKRQRAAISAEQRVDLPA